MMLLKIAIAVTTLAFASQGPSPVITGTHPVARPARASAHAKPSNAWKGSSEDLSVELLFEQGVDSIYARGTYTVAPTKRVGCGGETLYESGRFTMRAAGTERSFRGKLLFDSGWTPPVTASRTSANTIKVRIRSVDRGACVLTLHRVPRNKIRPIH